MNKVSYLTTAQFHRLELACRPIYLAFNDPPYLVGSARESPDFHDVDLRVILSDEEFDALFGSRPNLWGLLCYAVTDQLAHATGLPIDFQVQRMTQANEKFGGRPRKPMGMEARIFAGGGDATGPTTK